MLKLIKKKIQPISLKDHFLRRNKILIKRRFGGSGDILMQRMMFENFRTQFPHLEFSWAVPYEFIGMAYEHPYVETLEVNAVDDEKFGIIYDISTACRVYENKYYPPMIHRSDIWAAHCGIELTTHNMHLTVDKQEIREIASLMKLINSENKPSVLLAVHSTDDEFGLCKTLTDEQIINVVKQLRDLDFHVFSLHSSPLPIYERLNVDQFTNLTSKQWMAVVSLVDYVISVDTSTFHMAGGLKKPLVGIFSFTDGKVYGKYYDFALVQKHRDNGNWDCGPCFTYCFCPKSKTFPKPCLTELTADEIIQGLLQATQKWPKNAKVN